MAGLLMNGVEVNERTRYDGVIIHYRIDMRSAGSDVQPSSTSCSSFSSLSQGISESIRFLMKRVKQKKKKKKPILKDEISVQGVSRKGITERKLNGGIKRYTKRIKEERHVMAQPKIYSGHRCEATHTSSKKYNKKRN